MNINLMFTVIYFLLLFFSVYFQVKLSGKENRKNGFIIPGILVLSIVIVWLLNDFNVMKSLPISIVLFFMCIINIIINLFVNYHE